MYTHSISNLIKLERQWLGIPSNFSAEPRLEPALTGQSVQCRLRRLYGIQSRARTNENCIEGSSEALQGPPKWAVCFSSFKHSVVKESRNSFLLRQQVAQNKVVSFFCSAFTPAKAVRTRPAQQRSGACTQHRFPCYWEDPITEAGSFRAKEALKPVPIDLCPKRKQEGKLQTDAHNHIYTCTPSSTEAGAHARSSARTYLVFSATDALFHPPLRPARLLPQP